MKKIQLLALTLTALMALSLTACGSTPSSEKTSQQSALSSASSQGSSTGVVDECSDTDWLPSDIKQIKSETDPNPELVRAIIDYYQIPQEDLDTTRYYYNYVDLNNDGTEEILAVVMGPYTSGTGGDSMLWVLPYADMAVAEAFTLVRTPIIVTDELVNGAKQLILQRSGGGAPTELVALTCSDGVYQNVNEGTVLSNLDGITGTAIICNDLAADTESGDYLTLAK